MRAKVYPTLLITFLVSIIFIGTSCVSGKKRFENGDYDSATFILIKKLRNNPDNKKARQYLPLAYEHAVKYHRDVIKQLKESADPFKYDGVVSHYDKLNQLYNEIIKCPACLNIIPKPLLFQNEYNDAKVSASKAHFDYGVTELSKGTKETARSAYHHFMTAKNYQPQLSGIDTYLEQALHAGTVHVLVEDIPVHSRSLQLTNEFFQNAIMEHITALNYRFVRFYREADVAGSDDFVPDEVIVMQFDDFVVGQTTIKERVETIERDSVEIGKVTTEDGDKPVYGTVKAKLTTYEKTLTSSGLMDFQIVNAITGATIQQRKLPGTYVWQTQWATFNGQEEALSPEQIKLSKRREAFPPSPQDLFVEFTQPIYRQIIRSVDNYYRMYQ